MRSAPAGPWALHLADGLGPPLVIVGALVLVYLNSFLGVFQFDDFNVIVDNPAVHAWPASPQGLLGIRPLLKASYILNWTSGLGLFGFHALNLLVHAASALLVYGLALQVARQTQPQIAQRIAGADPARGAALVGALLFALHPVQTEAVTYISGGSSSLMTMFYLASVVSYIHGRPPGRAAWARRASPLLFALALATKEVAVTLPFALLLWEACVAQRRDTAVVVMRRLWPHWAVLLAAALAIAASPTYRSLLTLAPRLDTVPTQVGGVGYLLSRLVRIDALNIDPDLRTYMQWTATLALQALALAALLAAGLWGARHRPWLGFGILWLFLQLLPTNTLVVRWDIANERHLYLAGAGLFIAAGIEIERLQMLMPRRVVQTGIVALAVVLGLFTFRRNQDYSSQLALWEQAARHSPLKARVHNNLGYVQRLAGKREQARASFQRALALEPDYALARNNLRALEREQTERQVPLPSDVIPNH